MHVTLDNVLAFTILILVLAVSIGYIIPTAHISFKTVEEHQLEEIAQAVMDKMLLSPGDPEDWADVLSVNNASQLKSFGLQKAGGAPYELDVNKVLRIVNVGDSQLPETIRIDPDTIARLLGLGHDYGFSITIKPALNMSSSIVKNFELGKGKTDSVPSVLDVYVKTHEGRPAIGANVTGLYMLMTIRKKGNEDMAYVNYTFKTSVTNWEGVAKLNFTDYLQEVEKPLKDKPDILKKACPALIVYADYYGIRAVDSSILTDIDILKGLTVGGYVIVSYNYVEGFPNGSRHPRDITGLASPPYNVYLSGLDEAGDNPREAGWVVNKGAKNYRVYKLSNRVDDDVAFMMLPVKYTGEYWTLTLIRPPANAICRAGIAGNIKTSVLRRFVRIGSFHYIIEVKVWRWVE